MSRYTLCPRCKLSAICLPTRNRDDALEYVVDAIMRGGHVAFSMIDFLRSRMACAVETKEGLGMWKDHKGSAV